MTKKIFKFFIVHNLKDCKEKKNLKKCIDNICTLFGI